MATKPTLDTLDSWWNQTGKGKMDIVFVNFNMDCTDFLSEIFCTSRQCGCFYWFSWFFGRRESFKRGLPVKICLLHDQFNIGTLFIHNCIHLYCSLNPAIYFIKAQRLGSETKTREATATLHTQLRNYGAGIIRSSVACRGTTSFTPWNSIDLVFWACKTQLLLLDHWVLACRAANYNNVALFGKMYDPSLVQFLSRIHGSFTAFCLHNKTQTNKNARHTGKTQSVWNALRQTQNMHQHNCWFAPVCAGSIRSKPVQSALLSHL